MTNGENLKNIYPDLEIIGEIKDVYVIMLETHNVLSPKLEVFKSWLNAEYKEHKEKCIWIKYDYRTMCPKEHDVDNPYWRIPENRMETLKYCPYCGKEIEVQE